MNETTSSHTFFLPKKKAEQSNIIHASCYRLSLSMLRRAEHEPVAVPIDNMNYTALITDNEIYFADNSQTTSSNGDSGNPIRISWHLHLAEARDVNEQHIPMKTVYYDDNMDSLQQQLTGEYYRALMLMDETYRDKPIPGQNNQIKNITAS